MSKAKKHMGVQRSIPAVVFTYKGLDIPAHIQDWCDRNEHTDPECVEGQWRAYPPNAVMSVPVSPLDTTMWLVPLDFFG